MAQALYRRYRPDTFEGVIGQDQVTVPLMRALDNNKLTHAYLFSGPRGCGKTSSARILARCINCEQGPTSHPCGTCDSCRDLATGGPGSVDVVEIDAASHNGVDDARELREQAGFAPARDRYKIFILDEAHMVSQQGFNALLKIVEEPPEHVMFIFATTEPDKVIGTIRSRTHHYPFRLVPQEIMGPYLEDVCEKEQIETEPGVLRLTMRAGGGSVRDTLSVLDQLMVGAMDGEIRYDSAVALLGFTPDVMIGDAIDAVIDRDGAKLYDIVRKVTVGGYDARRFVEDLLARVRDLLVLTLGGDHAESVLDDDAEENVDELRRQQEHLDLRTLTAMAETMNDALVHMVGSISPRMRLELLAAKLMALRELDARGVSGERLSAAPVAPSVPAISAPAASTTPSGYHGGATAAGGYASAAHNGPRPSLRGAARAHTHPNDNTDTGAATSKQGSPESRPASSQPSTPVSIPAGAAAHTAGYPTFANQPSAPTPMARPHGLLPDPDDADRLWDGLVQALPEDVRSYVDRTKVPRVNLTVNQQVRTGRLWIKFDTPLSKYAFAIAMAQNPVDGMTSVVDILRARVRAVFGDMIQLAPTKKMANGETAPAWSKLSEQERQDYRARISRQNVSALAAAIPGIQIGIAPASMEEPAQSNGTEHATADSDSAASTTDMTPADAGEASDTSGAPSSAPTATSETANVAEDPWAMQMSSAATAAARFSGVSNDEDTARHSKTVPVPDMGDATDPWAASMSAMSVNRSDDTHPSSVPSDDAAQSASFVRPDTSVHSTGAVQSHESAPSPDITIADSTTSDSAVDDDDDEDDYSMSDRTIEQSNESNLDLLKRMFDVKKVEEFAANDPHNPKNARERKTLSD